jgi:hypothetical protein
MKELFFLLIPARMKYMKSCTVIFVVEEKNRKTDSLSGPSTIAVKAFI